ncbi:hypothetical protein AAF712_010288 [Marasmius tenuissimus]|uniref:Uncharacterized protein n=1 Tax=Marasmius tenuissimus TaxID=585030 RepID=A0ABR2ZNA9_9AGAR
MLVLLTISLLISSLSNSYSAQTIPPPSSLRLILPDLSPPIGPGALLPIGLLGSDQDHNTYWGLRSFVNVSVTYPNGTYTRIITDFERAECRIYPSFAALSSVPAVNGRFTAQWNITYAMNADTSQAIVGESCGSGPLSFQNFTLEHTFEVHIDEPEQTGPRPASVVNMTFLRTELGTQPTGSVLANPSPPPTATDLGGSGSGENHALGTRLHDGCAVMALTTIILSVLGGIFIVA